MTHRVAVVHTVEHHADLPVVFVGMVLGMSHRPVKSLAILLPLFFGHTEMLQPNRSGFTQPTAEFALAICNSRKNVFEDGRIRIFNLAPIDALVLFLRKHLLPQAFFIHPTEISVQLAVVAPDTHVVERLSANEIGFSSHIALFVGHELREPPTAVKCHAGLFGDFMNAILRGRHIVTNHGVAANRTGIAAGTAHGVLPHALAEIKL